MPLRFFIPPDPEVKKFDRRLGIYPNGDDNLYPHRIESTIAYSPTARSCAHLMRKYIAGKGFLDALDPYIVNKKKQITLYRLLSDIADSVSIHNGCFIHIGYNALYQIVSLETIPYRYCRLGREDDRLHQGKIYYSPNWDRSRKNALSAEDLTAYDAYNPLPEVIDAQIQAAGGFDQYRGQVFFFNPDRYMYPQAHIHPCLLDAESEQLASQYKHTLMRRGFFDKKIFISSPQANIAPTDEGHNQQRLQHIGETINRFLGVDHAGGAIYMEMDFTQDDIDKHFKVIDINSNVDDKLFAFTEQSVERNILKAYGAVPKLLVMTDNPAGFSQSGEMIRQARLTYQENTEDYRRRIQKEILEPLMSRYVDFPMPAQGLPIEKLVA